MRGRVLSMFVTLIAVATACGDDVRARYRATLSGSAERPNAVQSSGTGTFEATLNASNVLTYTLSFQNLNAPAILAHIHGPATTEQAAGVLVDFDAPTAGRVITFGMTSGTGSGTVDLNLPISGTVSGDSLKKLLDSGNAYVNVHSSAHTAGELRGQITPR